MLNKCQISAVGAAVAALAGALSSAAQAQEAQQLERVEVTGSRIKTVGAVSASPITSVGAEEIKSSQAVAVEEVIRGLPAAVPAVGPATNNGTGGGATINLRGLGAQRSLVLIDGKRLVPFDLSARVDTNSIPMALLQRVDLVTGGASAVYGADAVAGVVNFILKKNFQGIELSSSYGVSEQGDTVKKRTDLTVGGNFANGKGNAVLSLGVTRANPLMAGERDIGKTTLSSTNGLFSGSATAVPLVLAVAPATGVPASANTLGTGNRQLNLSTGRFEAFDTTKGSYNTNPLNYFQTPLDRRQVTALANYSINEHLEPYAQVFYTHSVVNSQLAESGSFGNDYDVPIGNPYISDAARAQICSARAISAANCVLGNTTLVKMTLNRRFTELGPRYNDFDNKTLQTTIGLKGELFGGWSYDVYSTAGEADQIQVRRNWGSFAKLQQALNAVSKTACVNPANGCVPINLFGAEGTITPAQLAFINLSSVLNQKVRQNVLAASASGDLGDFKLPTASSPIGAAFGAEQRKVFAATQSDGSSQISGEVLGSGAPTPDRSGSYQLNELFGELQVPLLQNLPFARNVSMELGYRHTSFKTDRVTRYGTSKIGADWEPIKGLRLRGMVQKATRAPNVNELFAPQVTGLSSLAVDPCGAAAISAADAGKAGTLSNLCVQTGVPASLVGVVAQPSSGQINVLSGGNPSLGPEKARTKTLGFVFEPSFIKNLLISVDYYKIDISDAISAPSTTDILDQCYKTAFNPALGMNAACGAVGRNPNNGTLNGNASKGVAVVSTNQGKLWTSGYDLSVNYSLAAKDIGLSPALGRLDLGFTYNQVGDNDFQATPTSIRRKCRGYVSTACSLNSGVGNNGTKFAQRGTWTMGDWSVGYNWRHLSALNFEPGSGTWFADYSHIPAVNYLDLNANWNYSKHLKLSLSVNNAANKQPPLTGNSVVGSSLATGNTLPSLYDPIGRYFTLGATFKF
ncbi:TonB-dependent receptor [Pelomonas sp. V22]|uniref:TonB-dependent receptor domain-containing protein n=1 Tax=Pelomonas sp. V22 TaxID=2822139 RepID=UPI0024A935B9|nr:TonB-dependent receptor [Pelomonas sp. V22]MDI4634784.1 TonB-dependent receptor [Pelomonas sp. V22]